MKPLNIVVLGGTGFVGSHLVPRLHAAGHRITVFSRNREQHRELGVLPRVRVENADVHDAASLTRQLEGADAAINLVGILNERGSDGRGFEKAHVALTETLIAACRKTGVRRLLQMSALRAGDGASHYLRTRFDAETRVRNSGLAWTIFRPSVIFGPGDGLFFRFASLLRLAPVLPLARAEARFAPVYVGDVAEAFTRALAHPYSIGRSYELFGPRVVSLREIVRWTAELSARRCWIIGLPDAFGYLQARIGEWLPGKPISRDNFRSLLVDSVGEKDGLGELGIVSTPMELIVPEMLGADRRQAKLDAFREEHRGA
ncbi:complex I NDUFA9 subunit family protein [Dokdonella immobilis]|uniref:NADH dehydrogenase n=1 Tax=Dokdonella immobilis TaxID=578942 RepID=A0A1I4ZHH3_9GAMM|nr:complex I NDUFA9 subunit family protein [Dokdonella immobilis]SFN49714.1 NADH dehydrogenase [Dokdonella immobilis]